MQRHMLADEAAYAKEQNTKRDAREQAAIDNGDTIPSRRLPPTMDGRDTDVAGDSDSVKPAPFNPRSKVRTLGGRGGAEYLDVKHRITWARDEHADLQIITEALQVSETFAFFKATVSFADELGTLVACTAHGSETKGDFTDFIEKAETKAVGRALQHLGYGTASMPDDAALADTPVERRRGGQKAITKSGYGSEHGRLMIAIAKHQERLQASRAEMRAILVNVVRRDFDKPDDLNEDELRAFVAALDELDDDAYAKVTP